MNDQSIAFTNALNFETVNLKLNYTLSVLMIILINWFGVSRNPLLMAN